MAQTETRVDSDDPEVATRISQALRGIKYGSVEIVIHDSRIVQIERKEKVRFEKIVEPHRGANNHGV
jgi:hypothetical protein